VRTFLQLADLKIGVLFVLAVSSVSVYAIAIGGWASNNKYALLGGLRGAAQMISYELPLALAIAAPLLMVNTLSFREIAAAQAGYYFHFIPKWAIFQAPMPQVFGFLIFLIAAFAETNRVPFDLPEAENELVAGFHTEYSSMKFAAFFMAEYGNMITASAVATSLFLGGWQPPFPAEFGSDYVPPLVLLGAAAMAMYHGMYPARPKDRATLPVVGALMAVAACVFVVPAVRPVFVPVFWFVAKAGFLLFVFIWVRATLPRFRYDQLMRFAWTFLFPLAMVNLLVTALAVAWWEG
jgi:NADH-quinone oxidoreductase subunit H